MTFVGLDMRPFLILISLMALALGFTGTALGVRPRPVAAGPGDAAARIESLERTVGVLTEALEDLEGRLDDHRARTPAGTPARAESPGPVVSRAEADRAPEPTALLEAALERAEDRVLAGDARGARDLFREILARPALPEALRVRARLGVAATWEILEAWSETRTELTALLREVEARGVLAPPDMLREIRARLARALREGDDGE